MHRNAKAAKHEEAAISYQLAGEGSAAFLCGKSQLIYCYFMID